MEDLSCEHMKNFRSVNRIKDIIHDLNMWRGAFNCKTDEERALYFRDVTWHDTFIPYSELITGEEIAYEKETH